jgi:heme exporter protein D|tara:strand:+ start:192 stop:419 length:228 start_codon:yes stop_codon:yes gene_type:complete
MIIEFLNMSGYALYVWSSFAFTLLCFFTLYAITKKQYINEKNKFVSKFGALDSKRAKIAKSQFINREILSSTQSI